MLLAPIVDQIKAQVGAFSGRVLGAVDLAAAQDGARLTPSAYVVPLVDQAGPNALAAGSVEQRVTERFGVIILCSNKRDALGAASHTDLQTLRRGVIDTLLGFQPDSGYDPIEYGGGRMLALDGQNLWWQLEFVSAYWERQID